MDCEVQRGQCGRNDPVSGFFDGNGLDLDLQHLPQQQKQQMLLRADDDPVRGGMDPTKPA